LPSSLSIILFSPPYPSSSSSYSPHYLYFLSLPSCSLFLFLLILFLLLLFLLFLFRILYCFSYSLLFPHSSSSHHLLLFWYFQALSEDNNLACRIVRSGSVKDNLIDLCFLHFVLCTFCNKAGAGRQHARQ